MRDLSVAAGLQGKTTAGDSLSEAGGFEVSIYTEYLQQPLLIRSTGGFDIDADDNGIEDEEPTANDIEFDFIVPSAAIRGEGTSNHYLPKGFPAIPASSVNLYCIGAVRKSGRLPRCGIIYTTDRRLWEFDDTFVEYLRNQRILGIDMELATLFSVAYRYAVPIGSIMLVSDMPLQIDGVKDKKKQGRIFSKYTSTHLDLALDAVKNMEANWDEVKRRLTSEW